MSDVCRSLTVVVGSFLVIASSSEAFSLEGVDPVRTVCFSYEGESVLTGSPVFKRAKTDYFWGEVQKRDLKARRKQYYVSRSNPDDLTEYTLSMGEWFTIDPQVLWTCFQTAEIHIAKPPQSLAEVKTIFAEKFVEGSKSTQTQRYFESVKTNSRDELLRGSVILGMTFSEPIWQNLPPETQADGSTLVYSGVMPNGTIHRFVYDKAQSIFVSGSSSNGSKDINGQPPFSYSFEVKKSGEMLVFKSRLVNSPSLPDEQITEETQRIHSYDLNCSQPIAMTLVPGNGDRIDSMNDPQIKYEWRDGKISKKLDPLKTHVPDKVEFRMSRNILLIFGNALVALVLFSYFVSRRFLSRRSG